MEVRMTPRRAAGLVAASVIVGVVLVMLARGPGDPVTSARAQNPPKDVRGHDAWRRAMQRLRVPARGCFTATYPTVQWRKVACVTPAELPLTPLHGHRPFTVGNNNDFAARSSRKISGAEGSFDSVSGVTSETGLE